MSEIDDDDGDLVLGESGEEDSPVKKKTKKKYQITAVNAQRCDVKQFYLRINFDGEALPENKWRCVLCSVQHPNDLDWCLHTTIEGNTPLHKHLLDMHGVKVLKEGERKVEKKGKKVPVPGKGQTTLSFPLRAGGARAATPQEIAFALTKLVVIEMVPFALVESDSFQEVKTLLRGHEHRQPDARKIRELVDAEEARIRKCASLYFQENLEYYAVSGDGKKAEIKGLPLYGVCLHGISKNFDPIVMPLFIGETEGKDALATKRFILKAVSGYKLSAAKIISFTGDEAEGAAGRLLDCNVLKCAPHRISTTVKRTFTAVGLFDPGNLLPATKEIVHFLLRRYKARQFSDEKRAELNKERIAKQQPPLLGFTEFSKTRFLGSLLMGSRTLMNISVIQEAVNHAILHSKEDPWSDFPEWKERFRAEWEDVLDITEDFVATMEHLSGELYPTLSDLAVCLQLLKTRVWRLGWRQTNPALSNGYEPPLDQHVWKSQIGQQFVEKLYIELGSKFDEDMRNPVVLVSTLLDPRYRTFLHPIRGINWSEKRWSDYKSVFSSMSSRLIDGKTLEARMMTAAVDLYRKYLRPLWDADMATLPADTQHLILSEGRVDRTPLWNDLKSWYSCRSSNLSTKDGLVGERTNPIDFWRECTTFASLKALAQMVLNIPVSALTIERFWSTQDKVMDKKRNRLDLETAGRLIYLRHVWRTAQSMLKREGSKLSASGRAFYESLLPFAGVPKG